MLTTFFPPNNGDYLWQSVETQSSIPVLRQDQCTSTSFASAVYTLRLPVTFQGPLLLHCANPRMYPLLCNIHRSRVLGEITPGSSPAPLGYPSYN